MVGSFPFLCRGFFDEMAYRVALGEEGARSVRQSKEPFRLPDETMEKRRLGRVQVTPDDRIPFLVGGLGVVFQR